MRWGQPDSVLLPDPDSEEEERGAREPDPGLGKPARPRSLDQWHGFEQKFPLFNNFVKLGQSQVGNANHGSG